MKQDNKVLSESIVNLIKNKETNKIIFSNQFAEIWASVFGRSSSLLAVSNAGTHKVEAAPVFVLRLPGPYYRIIFPATLKLIKIRKRMVAECL